MAGDPETVTLWKTSLRGLGERHLKDGYPPSDFPGKPGQNPDGCAYFARNRWIAELFADARLKNYEDFVIGTTIPAAVYFAEFQRFEETFHSTHGEGIEVAIPSEHLDVLNAAGVRFRVDQVSLHDE